MRAEVKGRFERGNMVMLTETLNGNMGIAPGNPVGNRLIKEILEMVVLGRKVSKYKIAKDLNVSETTVDNWVKGSTSPNDRNFNDIQDYHHRMSQLSRYTQNFVRK